MPVFFSDNGVLSEPEKAHSPAQDYEPVGIGKPLCVEILHVAFGDVRDLRGKAEVLVSSWAKLGGTGSPGPRVINVMRTGVDEFEHLSSFGAAEYGNPLSYYAPSYKGERLRLSIELLEIDKLRPEGVRTLGNALGKLARLAVFAPQLAYMTLAPDVLKLGRKLYNLLNRNDQVLLEHLDLAFDEPDLKVLTSGRFVIIHSNQRASTILRDFRLSSGSELVTETGTLAEETGMKSPYVVIRINAEEKPEYRDFEIDHATQERLAGVLNENITEEFAEFVRNGVAATVRLDAIGNLVELKNRLDEAPSDDEKRKIIEEAQNELRRLPDDLKNLVLSVLLPAPDGD
jgi:hypothetical protein